MKKLAFFLAAMALVGWSFATFAVADTKPVQEPEEIIQVPTTPPGAQTSNPVIPHGRPTSPQAYQLNWLSINGGGAVSASSTNYRLGLSVGQSVAGFASSSSYQMGIGFWYGAGGAPVCAATRGDMDASGTWTPTDAAKMLLCVYIVGWPGCDKCFADVNCSGTLTPADAALQLLRVYVLQPYPC